MIVAIHPSSSILICASKIMIVHTCLVLKIVITNKPYKPSSWILPMLHPKNASSPVRWSVSPLWCRGDVSGVARYGQILRTNKHQNLSLLSCYHWFYAPKKFEVLTCSICFLASCWFGINFRDRWWVLILSCKPLQAIRTRTSSSFFLGSSLHSFILQFAWTTH